MSVKNKQIFFTSFIVFLCFVFFYFVYPKYIHKIELERYTHTAKNNTKLILNAARSAVLNENYAGLNDLAYSLVSTADLSYLVVFDNDYNKLYELNDENFTRLWTNVNTGIKIEIKDNTIHILSDIKSENGSQLGTLQVGFDVFKVYNAFQENQLKALAILILFTLIIIVLSIIFSKKSAKNSNNSNQPVSKKVEEKSKSQPKIKENNDKDKVEIALPFSQFTPKDPENDKLPNLIERLSEKLDILESDLNTLIHREKKDTGDENADRNKIRQEFEFIVRLYKISNIYRKIAGVKPILSRICKDVCEEFMYDLALLYNYDNEKLIIYDSFTRGMPTLTEKYLRKCKNKPVNKNEKIYRIIKDKEPIFSRELPNCDVMKEMELNGHYAILPISSNDHVWAVLAVGLLGENMKVELRDVEKMLFYCNTVGTYLESVKNFETLGSNLKTKTRELVKANTLLRRSIREKDEFLRAISHDLIAPLRNIAGLINSIERIYTDKLEHGLEDRLFRIRRNVEKDMELVNEILEISRVKSRKIVIEKIDLNELILNIFENFNHELHQKKIKVKIQEKFPVIYFDKFIMNQILQNLVDNAIKYIKPDSKVRTISLNWRYVNKKVAFAISDTGIGIPVDELDKIFSIFYRSKNELNVETAGKGVGLAMIKSLLEKFNGEIWVKSKVDSGSIFYFTFPDTILRPPEIKKL